MSKHRFHRNGKGQFASKRSQSATKSHSKRRFRRKLKKIAVRAAVAVSVGGGYYLVKAHKAGKRAVIRAKVVTPRMLTK